MADQKGDESPEEDHRNILERLIEETGMTSIPPFKTVSDSKLVTRNSLRHRWNTRSPDSLRYSDGEMPNIRPSTAAGSFPIPGSPCLPATPLRGVSPVSWTSDDGMSSSSLRNSSTTSSGTDSSLAPSPGSLASVCTNSGVAAEQLASALLRAKLDQHAEGLEEGSDEEDWDMELEKYFALHPIYDELDSPSLSPGTPTPPSTPQVLTDQALKEYRERMKAYNKMMRGVFEQRERRARKMKKAEKKAKKLGKKHNENGPLAEHMALQKIKRKEEDKAIERAEKKIRKEEKDEEKEAKKEEKRMMKEEKKAEKNNYKEIKKGYKDIEKEFNKLTKESDKNVEYWGQRVEKLRKKAALEETKKKRRQRKAQEKIIKAAEKARKKVEQAEEDEKKGIVKTPEEKLEAAAKAAKKVRKAKKRASKKIKKRLRWKAKKARRKAKRRKKIRKGKKKIRKGLSFINKKANTVSANVKDAFFISTEFSFGKIKLLRDFQQRVFTSLRDNIYEHGHKVFSVIPLYVVLFGEAFFYIMWVFNYFMYLDFRVELTHEVQGMSSVFLNTVFLIFNSFRLWIGLTALKTREIIGLAFFWFSTILLGMPIIGATMTIDKATLGGYWSFNMWMHLAAGLFLFLESFFGLFALMAVLRDDLVSVAYGEKMGFTASGWTRPINTELYNLLWKRQYRNSKYWAGKTTKAAEKKKRRVKNNNSSIPPSPTVGGKKKGKEFYYNERGDLLFNFEAKYEDLK